MVSKGRILAIDYGEKNVGLACTDELSLTVHPLPSVPNSGRTHLIRKLRTMIGVMDVRAVVLGIPINMDGTSLYQGVAAVFISQALGFELTFADQLTIVLTALLASIGSAAVPGAGMVMLDVGFNAICTSMS